MEIKFIEFVDKSGQEQVVNISMISRLSIRKEWDSVHKEYFNSWCVEVSGALDGLACAARIPVSEETYLRIKSKLI